MFAGRRFVLLAMVATGVWYACILIFWAFQPLTDSVPVGIDNTLKQPAFVSVTVDCKGLFASEPRDSSSLPALKAQPKGTPPLGYQREACGLVQDQARMLFGLNTVFVLAAVAGFGWLVQRRRRSASAARLQVDSSLVGLPSS